MRKPYFWNRKPKRWSCIIIKSSKFLKEHTKTKIQDFHCICILLHCATYFTKVTKDLGPVSTIFSYIPFSFRLAKKRVPVLINMVPVTFAIQTKQIEQSLHVLKHILRCLLHLNGVSPSRWYSNGYIFNHMVIIPE